MSVRLVLFAGVLEPSVNNSAAQRPAWLDLALDISGRGGVILRKRTLIQATNRVDG